MPPEASVEERQRHLWQQLRGSEAKLQAATQEVQTLRTQQANEMKEVRHFSHLSVDPLLQPQPQLFVVHDSEEVLGQLNSTAASFELFNY